MTHAIGAPYQLTSPDLGRLPRRNASGAVGTALALAFGLLVGASAGCPLWRSPAPFAEPPIAAADVPPPAYNALLDPEVSLGVAPVSMAESAPLGPRFEPARAMSVAAATGVQIRSAPALPEVAAGVAVPGAAPGRGEVAQGVPVPDAALAPSEIAQNVPLPEPRPPAVRLPTGQTAFRPMLRQTAQRNRTSVPETAPPDNRNFIEKLFGMSAPGPALAYATPDAGFFGGMRSAGATPSVSYDRSTAIYDIAAHTVYMPDGARLEAHSGLGDRLDDPRHVNERNRGATPPNVYELEPRTQLFHGVQALRLNPVDNGNIFGRTGLLAHSYMLGPNGDSNGCVSFKNYNAFLQAYLSGQVRRLVVVARLS